MWKNTKEHRPDCVRPILVKIEKLFHISHYERIDD
jgi:hypothetical protein